MKMNSSPLRTRWNLFLLYYRKAKVQGTVKSARVLLKPNRVAFHMWRLLNAHTQAWSNFYVPSVSRTEEVQFGCQVSGHPLSLVEQRFAELDDDVEFVATLRQKYSSIRADSAVPFNLGRLSIWYVIVRLLEPDLVMETGVHDGLSSALILRALERNRKGALISIDLPSIDLPPGVDGAGWLVPPKLRSRWRLCVGDSRELLPTLVRQHSPIDIFIHDSDHRPEFQRFEYETVKPFLREAGLLLTDDAHRDLFMQLAKQWGVPCYLAQGGYVPGSEDEITLGGFRVGTVKESRIV